MALYNRRRYATSRLTNWVSKILRIERHAALAAIRDHAVRKRTVMTWAREVVGGDDKVAWQQRWVTEMRVPEYIARVLVADAVQHEPCNWTQHAFVTYNSPDWVVKGADNDVARFDGQDVDSVAAIAKTSAVGMELLENMEEFIRELTAKFPITATALALELCPQTLKDVPENHVAPSRPLAAHWLYIVCALRSHWLACGHSLGGSCLASGYVLVGQ